MGRIEKFLKLYAKKNTKGVYRAGLAAHLNSKPPITAKSYVIAVKEFLAENGIEFSQRELKRIRMKLPKGNARTVEREMDHETLRSICSTWM